MSRRLSSLQRYSTHVTKGGVKDPITYCRNLVRDRDYDSFLPSYFYPRSLQPAYFAIRAFNIELATVRETVSTPVIGQMRIQFWRDAIKNIYEDRPPQHPVALALHTAIRSRNLPQYHFKRIIDARDQELLTSTYQTVASVRSYAESTSSTILYLLIALLSPPTSLLPTLDHAASHLGTSQTISTLLRALPFHASKGRVVVPSEITAKHGVSQDEVIRKGVEAKGIEDAVYEFACVAKEELDVARDMFTEGRLPPEAMPVFLSGVPIASFLTRLEAVNFDTFHPSLQAKDWKLPFQVWRANSKRMF